MFVVDEGFDFLVHQSGGDGKLFGIEVRAIGPVPLGRMTEHRVGRMNHDVAHEMKVFAEIQESVRFAGVGIVQRRFDAFDMPRFDQRAVFGQGVENLSGPHVGKLGQRHLARRDLCGFFRQKRQIEGRGREIVVQALRSARDDRCLLRREMIGDRDGVDDVIVHDAIEGARRQLDPQPSAKNRPQRRLRVS